jgi:hypothetical protein
VYIFNQSQPNQLLGETTNSTAIKDSIYLKQYDQFAGLKFTYKNLDIETGLRYIHQKYELDSLKVLNGQTLPKQLIFNDLSFDSKVSIKLKKFEVHSGFKTIFTPDNAGYFLDAKTQYKFNEDVLVKASFSSSSTRPDYRFLLFQSGYDKFNWYLPDLKNEWIQHLRVDLQHRKWGDLSAKQIIVNNYTYFGKDSLPQQDKAGIKYMSLTYSKDFRYRRWGLANDIHLQKVLDGQELFSLPAYVFRTSLYYSRHFYRKNLFVQTGITFKYFDRFYPRAYHPVFSDFVLQDYKEIGNYPLVDYFVNFKVKRFRFYFKLEHFNALVTYKNPNYYAAPLQPIRDFSIRFGLRWIWFN